MTLTYPHKTISVINALEERLLANAYKNDTWKTCSHIHLRDKLNEEYSEVILSGYSEPKELADLSNITNMLLWRCAP